MTRVLAPATARLLLHQTTLQCGELESTWLELVGGELALVVDEGPSVLVPEKVLAAILRRYGRPLDAAWGSGLEEGALVLASGARVGMLRHLARYDVIAKDYLVYHAPGLEPLAELATGVSAALWFVVGRHGQRA